MESPPISPAATTKFVLGAAAQPSIKHKITKAVRSGNGIVFIKSPLDIRRID
jgi:hypothetical protein